MKQVIRYEAFNGVTFETPEGARNYELIQTAKARWENFKSIAKELSRQVPHKKEKVMQLEETLGKLKTTLRESDNESQVFAAKIDQIRFRFRLEVTLNDYVTTKRQMIRYFKLASKSENTYKMLCKQAATNNIKKVLGNVVCV